MVEHTHTFCLETLDHTHQTAEDCLSLCQITQDEQHHQLLTQTDYQELKLYLIPDLDINSPDILIIHQTDFIYPSFWENSIPEDIFHPPIG